MAYEPEGRLVVAVSTTVGPDAPDGNTAQTFAERIAPGLSPERPLAD
ncbi:hypothetical protein AB0F96_16110 [Streptomyces sp. NPDC023998]